MQLPVFFEYEEEGEGEDEDVVVSSITSSPFVSDGISESFIVFSISLVVLLSLLGSVAPNSPVNAPELLAEVVSFNPCKAPIKALSLE